jgi:hypothetical protein
LKLADHRFLFVNSHLAAHTKRVSARLANIVKIKAELNLDTFLPKDDPRNNEADIADRFDSVFWCGDCEFPSFLWLCADDSKFPPGHVSFTCTVACRAKEYVFLTYDMTYTDCRLPRAAHVGSATRGDEGSGQQSIPWIL